MVFFSCDACNESLKKNQVEKHTFRCRSNAFSCIDCQKVFTAKSYASHLKCITEDEKYGGKNYVAKENKGEAKQNAWVDQVERAIEAVQDRSLKELLTKIQGFANIPRKEAKFINFLINSIRIKNRDLCTRAWKAIAEEAAKIKAEEDAAKAVKEEEKRREEVDVKAEEEKKAFKWKATIKRKLKENGGEMKVKKLKAAVREDYSSQGIDVDEQFEELFNEKLVKAGVVVEGKTATLS